MYPVGVYLNCIEAKVWKLVRISSASLLHGKMGTQGVSGHEAPYRQAQVA